MFKKKLKYVKKEKETTFRLYFLHEKVVRLLYYCVTFVTCYTQHCLPSHGNVKIHTVEQIHTGILSKPFVPYSPTTCSTIYTLLYIRHRSEFTGSMPTLPPSWRAESSGVLCWRFLRWAEAPPPSSSSTNPR